MPLPQSLSRRPSRSDSRKLARNSPAFSLRLFRAFSRFSWLSIAASLHPQNHCFRKKAPSRYTAPLVNPLNGLRLISFHGREPPMSFASICPKALLAAALIVSLATAADDFKPGDQLAVKNATAEIKSDPRADSE